MTTEHSTNKYRVYKRGETLHFEGTIRPMNDEDTDPIQKILDCVVKSNPESVHLDVTALKFLNSSGINMLCRFAMDLRDHQVPNVKVFGSKAVTWQARSLGNLKGLNPGLELELAG